MARLPDFWNEHLQQGCSLRIGSVSADGRPELHVGHGAWLLPDGRMELMVRSLQGAELLAAIRATGRIAVSAGVPSTYRVLHMKGLDAEVLAADAEQAAKLAVCFEAWLQQIERYGADRRRVIAGLGELTPEKFSCVRFTPLAAWDQTPGPGAGQAIDLLP
jgi:hypothetical protein